jgi:hypothetical protein
MSTNILQKDLDVRTIDSLKQAYAEVHEDLRSSSKKGVTQPHDGTEWDTSRGDTYLTSIVATFVRLNHNMLPDLLEAVSILAEAFEADNRVYGSDAECDDREHDMQVAMGKASVLLDKLHAKVPSKEGAAARGLKKAVVHYHGSNCPACDSDNIEANGEVNLDSSVAWQSVKCNNCDFEWDDIYSLKTIDIKKEHHDEMMFKLGEAGIEVYRSENYGFGFTHSKSAILDDNFETENDAMLSAWKYAADNNLIPTEENEAGK